MKVFISWSGEASKGAAEVLRTRLPQIIQSLEPFMSKHDLSSGGRWAHQLSQELEQSSFGIVCLTPDNLTAPWLLFEAGALTKHVEGKACCLLLQGLGPTDVADPLAQFQNRRFAKDEIWQLIVDLNKHLEKPLDPSTFREPFENWWWKDVEEKVAAALASTKIDAPKKPERSEPDLLEEVLVRVRNVERSLAERFVKGRPSESLAVVDAPPEILMHLMNNFIKYSTHTNLRKTLGHRHPDDISIIREFFDNRSEDRSIAVPDLRERHNPQRIKDLIADGIIEARDDVAYIPQDFVSTVRSVLQEKGIIDKNLERHL